VTQSLSSTRPRKPAVARVAEMRVVSTARVSSGFVRVTLVGDAIEPMGYDQWFRLFLPAASGRLELPHGDAEGWYTRWLALDEAERTVVRNYTVRAARPDPEGWQIDVDLVVHRSPGSGSVEGAAAAWALAARPGDVVGVLGQGVIVDEPDAGHPAMIVIADESGLPAAEGIARSLHPDSRAEFVLEVPRGDDRRALPTAATITEDWIVRDDDAALPGRAALNRVESLLAARGSGFAHEGSYAYVVGEASFVLATRALLRAAGVPKHAVHFCAYWRPERRA
jgi:NADPH-dependent ferric siderophore reductase